MTHATQTRFTRIVAVSLTSALTLGEHALAAPVTAVAQQPSCEDQLRNTTTEVQLRMKVKNGSNVSGRLLEVRSDAITVGNPRRWNQLANCITFRPTDVVGVQFLTKGPTRSESEIAVVRFVVGGLAIGKTIEVKTAVRQFRGTLQSFDETTMTVAHGRPPSTQIAYSDLLQVERAGTDDTVLKAAIIAGVAAGVFLVILAASGFFCPNCS
jgi:hypothetical protein